MSNIRKYFVIPLVSLCLIYPTAAYTAKDFIKVTTFNIAELGEGSYPDTRDELGIARMLVNLDLDLVAMQEVGIKESGEAQVQIITSDMNSLLAPDASRYNCITTFFETGDERYAFIWRSPVVMTPGLYCSKHFRRMTMTSNTLLLTSGQLQ